MSTEPLRVLLVDDHEEFRAGLAALLAAADGCEVVGSAADGRTKRWRWRSTSSPTSC